MITRIGRVLAAAIVLAGSLAAGTPAARLPAMSLTSETFSADGTLPQSAIGAACGGKDQSPELRWSGAPVGTKSFAIVVHDPDAKALGGFWHWILLDVPPGVSELPAGAGSATSTGVAGHNDLGVARYSGPCPPAGDLPHHYRFLVLALDVGRLPGVGPRTTGAALPLLLRGHVLARGLLIGRYGR